MNRQQRRAQERAARKAGRADASVPPRVTIHTASDLRQQIMAVARNCYEALKDWVGRIHSQQSGRLTESQLIGLLNHQQEYAATQLEPVLQRSVERGMPPPACKAGCSYCCHLEPAVTPAEIIRLLAYIRETFTPDEIAALRERTAARLAGPKPNEKGWLPTPCPLLVNDRCSVYPVRPLNCAGYNSADVEHCREWFESQGFESRPQTVFTAQVVLHEGIYIGIRDVLRDSGYRSDNVRITRALLTGLDTPDAGERWLAGEDVFAAAHFIGR